MVCFDCNCADFVVSEKVGKKFLINFFLVIFLQSILITSIFLFIFYRNDLDHLTAISQGRNSEWYKDLGGFNVSEIQDQDLFYHNIGKSINSAKKADIIILGSSLASFGFNSSVLNEKITKPFGLKVYNMSFVGVASGEFAKRIALKFELHPRLWIINADDGGGGGNFFSRSVIRNFCADTKTISATEHNRLQAFFDVVRRNLLWRIEDLVSHFRLHSVDRSSSQSLIPEFYRNYQTGEVDMSAFPKYLSLDNPNVYISRPQDCHSQSEVINIAKQFTESIGSRMVLSLVPNIHSCSQQAKEIADSLGVELLLPSHNNYSSWDKGGHLDLIGSIKFTQDFVGRLIQSKTFKDILSNRLNLIVNK